MSVKKSEEADRIEAALEGKLYLLSVEIRVLSGLTNVFQTPTQIWQRTFPDYDVTETFVQKTLMTFWNSGSRGSKYYNWPMYNAYYIERSDLYSSAPASYRVSRTFPGKPPCIAYYWLKPEYRK